MNIKTLQEVYQILDSIEPDEHGCQHYPSKKPIGYYRKVVIEGKAFRVNRLALERKLGRPIKPGFQALHTCDCKSCVTEAHLYEGTDKNNRDDFNSRYKRTLSNETRKQTSERMKEQWNTTWKHKRKINEP